MWARQRGEPDVAEEYLRKGRQIYVEDALATRKYQDKSGAERITRAE